MFDNFKGNLAQKSIIISMKRVLKILQRSCSCSSAVKTYNTIKKFEF